MLFGSPFSELARVESSTLRSGPIGSVVPSISAKLEQTGPPRDFRSALPDNHPEKRAGPGQPSCSAWPGRSSPNRPIFLRER